MIPSLPGHGFSAIPTGLGWDPLHVAKAWITLMMRLGYTKYVAQGGDWGNAISGDYGIDRTAWADGYPYEYGGDRTGRYLKSAGRRCSSASESDSRRMNAYNQLDYFNNKGIAYALEMGSRPQTLYGLDDSPIGLAAWMLDHDISSYKLIARVFAGQKEGLTKDDILDNITLYWLTNTAVSSARLYWEASQGRRAASSIPGALKFRSPVSVFPDEIYAAPEAWAKRAYPNLIHYNKLPKGGHFAAWEQPEFLTEELRVSFKSYR